MSEDKYTSYEILKLEAKLPKVTRRTRKAEPVYSMGRAIGFDTGRSVEIFMYEVSDSVMVDVLEFLRLFQDSECLFNDICCPLLDYMSPVDPNIEPEEYRVLEGKTKEIKMLLHRTPIEDVPLYINSLPIWAQWRLEIGK